MRSGMVPWRPKGGPLRLRRRRRQGKGCEGSCAARACGPAGSIISRKLFASFALARRRAFGAGERAHLRRIRWRSLLKR